MPLFYGFCSETFLSEHGLCVTLHFVRLWHSIGRVVYRGYNNANANGGVSFANATNDASNTNTNVGSRLAFRGNLVRAQSVAAYKAIIEVA